MPLLKKSYVVLKKFTNSFVFYLSRCLPLNKNLIVLESEGDFSDNSEALYNYMKNNNYLRKYKVVWLVDNKKCFNNTNNTVFVSKKFGRPLFRAMYYLARCGYYIYDHNNLLQYGRLKKRRGQSVIYMSHGTAFKDGKSEDPSASEYFDNVVTLGKMSTQIICHFWGCPIRKALELGETREDYYKSDLTSTESSLDKFYSFSKFNKVILWMPTFRKSNNPRISEDYLSNETGLPILNCKQDLDDLNNFLKEKNLCILLKLHHLQAKLPSFNKNYSNIFVIRDSDLNKINVKLYQFIALTDALITDYSSISVDYLPLNRPIIYTLDDYDDYNKSRGIYPQNARDYMPGDHVVNVHELKNAINNVAYNRDEYKTKRQNVKNLFYKYEVGNTSKRILDYLEIKL